MGMAGVLSEVDGAVAVLTLNRPERRNALSLELMRELTGALRRIGEDREIRVVILAAAGTAFCSGHDLREMVGRSIEEYRELFDACSELMAAIQGIPQAVIARVQGVATAAGCQLVAACDLAVASGEATFATPGVKIGLFCTTPGVAVVRAIGRKRALEMLLTGRAISADRAAEWGLVNRVVPAVELESSTRELAQQIAEGSGFTLGLGKSAFYRQCGLAEEAAYAFASETMGLNALSRDAAEGISAFLEKRNPTWVGR
jgi:enoyl-CoA hydratase/carnithine racemase